MSDRKKIEEQTIFKFFGEVEKIWEDGNFCSYKNNVFRISVYRSNHGILVSCDLIEYFDKDSKNPINFFVSLEKKLSRRKEKRIFEGLNFLVKNKKEAGVYFGAIDGFDDLSYVVRDEFLIGYYK